MWNLSICWYDMISHHMLQVYMLICVIFHSPQRPQRPQRHFQSLQLHVLRSRTMLSKVCSSSSKTPPLTKWLDNFWGNYQTVHFFNLRMLVIFRRLLEITNISCGMDPSISSWRVLPVRLCHSRILTLGQWDIEPVQQGHLPFDNQRCLARNDGSPRI